MTDKIENPQQEIIAPSRDTSLTAHDREFINSLSGLADNLMNTAEFRGSVQLSQTDTMYLNNRWYLVSNNRQLLSQMYVEHGIVQTLIDQPVEDAYRAGFSLKTDQLDKNELEDLEVFMEEMQLLASHGEGVKWGRLFGGGGVLIITDQDPATPFEVESLNEGDPIAFKPVDMWELTADRAMVQGDMSLGGDHAEFYTYYGKKVHKSRVLKITGKKAPSFVQPRLRDWGMSEVEKLVRSINSYLKNQDVVFELLDEAKVDVYKIKGFTSALAQKGGSAAVAERIQTANVLKNYNNALTMDSEDDYSQKQMAFTGLSDMLLQIRQGIAADLKMPMTKIFGISAAGFNSGEDDIENYNSMLESEIRNKYKFQILMLVKVCCQVRFGFIPDDMKLTWPPLRVLSAEQEENVKEKKFNRVVGAFDRGLASPQAAKQSINKDSLLGIEIDENDDLFDLQEEEPQVSVVDSGGGKEKTNSKTKKLGRK